MRKIFCSITLWLAVALAAHCQLKLPTIALTSLSALVPTPALNKVQLNTLQVDSIPNTAAICNLANACSVILPVTAIQLQGTRLNNYQVALTWKTKNETNSKGFRIERSFDNANNFLLAGNIASNPSNSVEKNYAQIDLNSFNGNTFYRIKQIDLNGNFTYSNTIEVHGYTQKENISLAPNPASDHTVLTCYSLNQGKGKVIVLAAHGQKLYQSDWLLSTGTNYLNLPVSDFLSGIYFVQMIWPNGYYVNIKLVVK